MIKLNEKEVEEIIRIIRAATHPSLPFDAVNNALIFLTKKVEEAKHTARGEGE